MTERTRDTRPLDEALSKAPDVVTRPRVRVRNPLLPYQAKFNADESMLRIWEKSRRIGATFGVAADVTSSRLSERRNEDVWFSSADESAAAEFIEYVDYWTRVFSGTARKFTEDMDDGRAKVTHHIVEFPSGKRVTAMTSNPRRFRSKGGDVILDEFAYHDRPKAMLAAALPCTTWGGRATILSTHNGEGSHYARLIDQGRRHAEGTPQPSDMPWSVHRTTIIDAINDGLAGKINETKGTEFTDASFLQSCRWKCDTDDDFKQEYMCEPSSESRAYLTYDLINSCVSGKAAERREDLALYLDDMNRIAQDASALYAGVDVGRTQDLFVIWVIAKFGTHFETAGLLAWRGRRFKEMQQAIDETMKFSVNSSTGARVRRMCIDSTGLGMQLAEQAEETYRGRCEGIAFTAGVKEDLATTTRIHFEGRSVTVPDDSLVKDQLHSIRKVVTSGQHARYDGERNADGHADLFWGLALGLHASEGAPSQGRVITVTGGDF